MKKTHKAIEIKNISRLGDMLFMYIFTQSSENYIEYIL